MDTLEQDRVAHPLHRKVGRTQRQCFDLWAQPAAVRVPCRRWLFIIVVGEVEVVVVDGCVESWAEPKRISLVHAHHRLLVAVFADGLQARRGWRRRKPVLQQHAREFVAHRGGQAALGKTAVPAFGDGWVSKA